MLSKYRDGQPIAFNILKNEINKNSIAHAYLFSSTNINIANDFAMAFAKTLFCPEKKLDQDGCIDCNICKRIDDGNYSELKIIEPDGLWIKKEQLLDLQESFNMKSLEGNIRIYIIKDAEKLNSQAANCILKFLEEPEANIMAILTTSDIHSVLSTIVSRCQVIFLKDCKNIEFTNDISIKNKTLLKFASIEAKSLDDFNSYLNDENNLIKIEAIVSFVKKYEVMKTDVLLEIKKLWFDHFTEKAEVITALDMMGYIYKDILNIKLKRSIDIFDYYGNVLNEIAENNELNQILYKIKKINLTKEKVKYNVNLNLLMDKLIIEMESGENL
jgi:DNA polymerase-3 subunit delta'